MKWILNKIILVSFLFFETTVLSAELLETNTCIRCLGMGDVTSPIARDVDAIYYNPAMLGFVTGIHYEVFDVGFGLNGLDAMTQLTSISSDSSASNLSQYMGSRFWLGAEGKTALVTHNFGFAAFDSGYLLFKLHDPVVPKFETTYLNDTTYILGTAFELNKNSYLGISFRQINRAGGTADIGASSLTSGSALTSLMDQFQDAGQGLGVDLAYVYKLDTPFQPMFTAVWQNFGGTSFRLTTGTTKPAFLQNNLSLGFSSFLDLPGLDWTNAIEYRNYYDFSEDYGKKIHLGSELSIPFITLRAGINQGYTTYGLGLNLLIMDLDVAYYSEELGAYPGQDGQNRIMIGLKMDVGFDADFSFSSFGTSNGKKRKMKQRR